MDYWMIGRWAGAITAAITFVCCWIYAIASWGFLLGVGFGWIPAAIIAAIAGGLMVPLWGLAAILIALLIVLVVKGS